MAANAGGTSPQQTMDGPARWTMPVPADSGAMSEAGPSASSTEIPPMPVPEIPPMPRRSVPDSESLSVVAFNVGLIQQVAFKKTQDDKVRELGWFIGRWLRDHGVAVVGLKEIHETIASKLKVELLRNHHDVNVVTQDTNALVWCTP